MKIRFIALLALTAMECQARAVSFPIGTYTSCAQGTHSDSRNSFVNVSGFQPGAVLTLAQAGTTLTSTFVDQSGLKQSLRFSATTPTTATVAQSGQVIPGFAGLCVAGPGTESRYPASMTVNAGMLTYTAGTVVLTLSGRLQSDAGTCGRLSQPVASFWLLCADREGGAVPAVDVGTPPVTPMPVGQFTCSSQIDAHDLVNGINRYVAGGASGTLTLAQDGAKLTAEYAGDSSLAGTLHLITGTATAHAEAGQTLMAPCMIPGRTGVASTKPEPLSIASASLTFVDSRVFLAVAGATAAGSSCPGAQVAGSLICAK